MRSAGRTVRHTKKRILILGILAAVMAVAGFYWFSENNKDDGALVLSGNVEVTEVDLGFRIGGRIKDMSAEEGDYVEMGARLASLESGELKGIVRRESGSLRESEARLRDLKAGSRAQEIGKARAALESARAELERAGNDFDRASALYNGGVLAKSEYDAAKSSYESRAAFETSAKEHLSLVAEGPRPDEVSAAYSRVEQSRAALAVAEERLRDAFINSPISGVILRRYAEPGEITSASVPVYTVGDLSKPWIKVYVKEDKLGLVNLGQRAEVAVDSFPDKKFEGKVSYISSEAEFTPKNIQTQEERVKLVFAVKVSVVNEGGVLKPGMPSDVRLELK